MIFRGRPGSIIITETLTHVYQISSASDMGTILTAVYGIGSTIVELIGGPALGVALTAVFVFLAYKSAAVLFSKFFNKK